MFSNFLLIFTFLVIFRQLHKLTQVLLTDYPIYCAGQAPLASICPNIVELDLSNTFLSSWYQIGAICDGLKNLETLNLRFVNADKIMFTYISLLFISFIDRFLAN